MKAFILLALLPMDIVRHIHNILANDAVNTIIQAYYRKTLMKINATKYFCKINFHIYEYGYYNLRVLPSFIKNLKLASRVISEHDDHIFWWDIYINIQKTLSYETCNLTKSIIGVDVLNNIKLLANNLRLSLGGYLTYY